jgi:hypothetical protein
MIHVSFSNYVICSLLSVLVGVGFTLTVQRFLRTRDPKEIVRLPMGVCLLAGLIMGLSGNDRGWMLVGVAAALAFLSDANGWYKALIRRQRPE